MTKRSAPPVSVAATEFDGPPIDIDRWVARYVEIGMRVEGVTPGGGSGEEDRRTMRAASPTSASGSR